MGEKAASSRPGHVAAGTRLLKKEGDIFHV